MLGFMDEIFPTLQTEYLILNSPSEQDLDDIVSYLNHTSEFSENTLNLPFPYKKENANFWLTMSKHGFENKNAFVFAVREKESGKIIGGIGLHIDAEHCKAEVGYWLAKKFWNRGYVTEALHEIIRFGFQNLNLNKIYATHFIFNPASGRVLQKSGMKQEGILKQEIFKNGEFLDVVRYSILKENFLLN